LNVVICASSRTQPRGQGPWEKAQSSHKKIFCSLIFLFVYEDGYSCMCTKLL
jgi:hypothetical protein